MFRLESGIGDKSRIALGIRAVRDIIRKKKKEDQSDRYCMVVFNGSVKIQNDLFFSESDILKFFKSNAEFDRGSYLGEALAAGLRIIIGELRKIGEKTTRILVVSDGISHTSAMNPINIAKLAQELGIIIDVLRFGPAKVPGNIFKRLTEITNGDYCFVSDESELVAAIDKISKKKEGHVATIFEKKDKSGGVSNELLSEIAGTLLKIDDLTPEQKFRVFSQDPNKKMVCSICYSNSCMICQTNFYGCGRFCPNCLNPVHMHCAMAWADQQNKGKNESSPGKYKIFRCVHCFYLLKIPTSNLTTAISDENGGGDRTAVKIKTSSAPSEAFNTVCAHPNCGIVFNPEEDEFIYKCNNCNSYFHSDCFEDFYNREKKCPNCKRVIKC
jgi:hypothetical protein